MNNKFVYLFSEGSANMRDILGGKGANLAEMTKLGLSVPQGFIVTTEACNDYYTEGKKISEEVVSQVNENMKLLEGITNKNFNSNVSPLLVSVRSGARASMPGMMDTVLNLGLNDEVVLAIAEINPKLAYDSYRRLIMMFADVVKEVDKTHFDKEMEKVKEKYNVDSDHDLSVEALKEVVELFKEVYFTHTGSHFPQDPQEQLISAIEAVFKSWNNPRAQYYRRLNKIPDDWGTAVSIQEMVFGNMGENCATGVAFSRNPANGEKELYGEFLYNAQGEDVVAGTHTPLPISELKESMPKQYNEFKEMSQFLEKHYHDMQDMEFTIENGKLFILQTRSGKRTAQAAVKIATDLYDEGVISKQEAIDSLDLVTLENLLHPQFKEEVLAKIEPIGSGLPASPGASSGVVVFEAERVSKYTDQGLRTILVRMETSPEDIEGMHLSSGILTARGGMTSHAAVVARGMGKACIVGSNDLRFYDDYVTIGGHRYNEGDQISIDGGVGKIYDGELETESVEIGEEFSRLLEWADELAGINVYTNADSAHEIQTAVDLGAKGVGLVRTEHMFFEADRIRAVREMILSTTKEQRQRALDKLLPIQRNDFESIFETTKELPVTIRLLDPPLHEFMPNNKRDIEELAKVMDMEVVEIESTIKALTEINPMMGHRGCRLAITYPEISLMQTQAIVEAAINVGKAHPEIKLSPEIMIPLAGDAEEYNFLAKLVRELADKLIEDAKVENVAYTVGAMIELPRACLIADEIAVDAEFFSFGTNDLTQMTYGFSRDDAGSFLPSYYELGIYDFDPFISVDQVGVGEMTKIGIERGRSVKPDLLIGICGEHGGDPASVMYFREIGVDYVSCSPFRVPIARISAARTK